MNIGWYPYIIMSERFISGVKLFKEELSYFKLLKKNFSPAPSSHYPT